MGHILAVASLSKLVVATDTPYTYVHDLTHLYEASSGPEVSLGIRFFYVYDLAIALLSMGVISASHVHKAPLEMRVPEFSRLANCAAVCLAMSFLPLTRDHLD